MRTANCTTRANTGKAVFSVTLESMTLHNTTLFPKKKEKNVPLGLVHASPGRTLACDVHVLAFYESRLPLALSLRFCCTQDTYSVQQ